MDSAMAYPPSRYGATITWLYDGSWARSESACSRASPMQTPIEIPSSPLATATRIIIASGGWAGSCS